MGAPTRALVLDLDRLARKIRTQREAPGEHLTADDWHRIRKAMQMFAHNTEFKETIDKLERMK